MTKRNVTVAERTLNSLCLVTEVKGVGQKLHVCNVFKVNITQFKVCPGEGVVHDDHLLKASNVQSLSGGWDDLVIQSQAVYVVLKSEPAVP